MTTAKKISYAVVDIVASTKSELSKISQVKFFSYSCGYSLTDYYKIISRKKSFIHPIYVITETVGIQLHIIEANDIC